uniref:Nuclear receptor domain-containing protein n=1 Tax=Acrobeloides nanus TaxID=290746 RepID=A0A914C907_9BILA
MITCAICDRNTDRQRHYGAQVCPACFAFFRRSLAEEKEYTCKGDGNCNVKKEFRNICRACRLKLCFEAGMRREDAKNSTNSSSPSEVTHYENYQLSNSSNHIPSSIPYQTKLVPDTSIEQQYPTLSRLTEGIKKFQDAQKTVIIAQNSAIMFSNSKFKLIKKSLLYRLQQACVPLIYSMINDYFDLSHLLNFEQKHQLLKSFAMKFWFLIINYQTTKLFPNLDDTRLIIDSTYVIDYKNANHIHYFLCEFENPEKQFE